MNLTKIQRQIVQSTLRKWHHITAHRVSADGMVTDKEGKHIGKVKAVIWTHWFGPAKTRKCRVQYIHFRSGADYEPPRKALAQKINTRW